MPKLENDIQAEIMLAAGSLPGVRLFRNNVGLGWCGKLMRQEGDAVLIAHARAVKFGLMAGSGDLIGWRSVEITPDMVGQRIAQLVSIEVKSINGRAALEQQTWRANVNAAGGCGWIIRTPEDAVRKLRP